MSTVKDSEKGDESSSLITKDVKSAGVITEDDFNKYQASMSLELPEAYGDANCDDNSDPEVGYCSDVNKNHDKSEKNVKRVRFNIEPIAKEKMIVKGTKRPKDELLENKEVSKNKKRKEFEPPKLKGDNRDIFCWKCHKFGDDVLDCSTCVRVYHLKCSQLPKKPLKEWICPECNAVMSAEKEAKGNGVISRVSISELSELLLFVMKRIRHHEGSKHFEEPVDVEQYPEYLDYIVRPTYLGLLEENIKKYHYKSCEQFICDTRWMVHNSYIFNTAYSEFTLYARAMVKNAKQECEEIINCPDCYLHANTLGEKEWFIEPCTVPHILVWARLKGWPYWPCKVMKVIGNNVDVRFFGDHNKSLVPVDCCYLYSKQMPSKQKKFDDLDNAIEECKLHLEKLESRYGKFIFAPVRTNLKPKEEIEQRKLLLPGFYGLPIPTEENEAQKPETPTKSKIHIEDCKVTIVVPKNDSPSMMPRNDAASEQKPTTSSPGERKCPSINRPTYNQIRNSTGNMITAKKPVTLISQTTKSAFSHSPPASMKPTIIIEDVDEEYCNAKKFDSVPGSSRQFDPLAAGPSNKAYWNNNKTRPFRSPSCEVYCNKTDVDLLTGGPSKQFSPTALTSNRGYPKKDQIDPLAGPPKVSFSASAFNRAYSKKVAVDPLAGPPKQSASSQSILFKRQYSNKVEVDPLAGLPKQNNSHSILFDENPYSNVVEVDPLASPPKNSMSLCNNNVYPSENEVDPLADLPEKITANNVTNETEIINNKQVDSSSAGCIGRIKVKPEFSSANMTLNLNNFFQSGKKAFGFSDHLRIQSPNQEHQSTNGEQVNSPLTSPQKKMFLPIVSKLVSIDPVSMAARKPQMSQTGKDVILNGDDPLVDNQSNNNTFEKSSMCLTGSVSMETNETVQLKITESQPTAGLTCKTSFSECDDLTTTESTLLSSGEEEMNDEHHNSPDSRNCLVKVQKPMNEEIKKLCTPEPQLDSKIPNSSGGRDSRLTNKELSFQKLENNKSSQTVCKNVEIRKRLANGKPFDYLVPSNAFNSVERDIDDILLGPSSSKRVCHGIIKRNKNANKQITTTINGSTSKINTLNKNEAILKQLSGNSSMPNVINIINKSHSDAPIVIIKSSKTSNKVVDTVKGQGNVEKITLSPEFRREKSILKVNQIKPKNDALGVSYNQMSIKKLMTADSNSKIKDSLMLKAAEDNADAISTPQIDRVVSLDNHLKINSEVKDRNLSVNRDCFELNSVSNKDLIQIIRKPLVKHSLLDSNRKNKNSELVSIMESHGRDLLAKQGIIDESFDKTDFAQSSPFVSTETLDRKNELKSEKSGIEINDGDKQDRNIDSSKKSHDDTVNECNCFGKDNNKNEETDKCISSSSGLNQLSKVNDTKSNNNLKLPEDTDTNKKLKDNSDVEKRWMLLDNCDKMKPAVCYGNKASLNAKIGEHSKTTEISKEVINKGTKVADKVEHLDSSNLHNAKVKDGRYESSVVETADIAVKDQNCTSSNLSDDITEAKPQVNCDRQSFAERSLTEAKESVEIDGMNKWLPFDSDSDDTPFLGFELDENEVSSDDENCVSSNQTSNPDEKVKGKQIILAGDCLEDSGTKEAKNIDFGDKNGNRTEVKKGENGNTIEKCEHSDAGSSGNKEYNNPIENCNSSIIKQGIDPDSEGVNSISDSKAGSNDDSQGSESDFLTENNAYASWVYSHITTGMDIQENDDEDSSYKPPSDGCSTDESDDSSSGISEDFCLEMENQLVDLELKHKRKQAMEDKDPSKNSYFVNKAQLEMTNPQRKMSLMTKTMEEHLRQQEVKEKAEEKQQKPIVSNGPDKNAHNEILRDCKHDDNCQSIREIKSKRWCALCFKEAVFHCCWLAAYCSESCQFRDWDKHQGICKQSEMRFTESDIRLSPVLRALMTDATTKNVLFKDFEKLLKSKGLINDITFIGSEASRLMEGDTVGNISSAASSSQFMETSVASSTGLQFSGVQHRITYVPTEMASPRGNNTKYPSIIGHLNNTTTIGKKTFIISNNAGPGKLIAAPVIIPPVQLQTQRIAQNENKLKTQTELRQTYEISKPNGINIDKRIVQTVSKDVKSKIQSKKNYDIRKRIEALNKTFYRNGFITVKPDTTTIQQASSQGNSTNVQKVSSVMSDKSDNSGRKLEISIYKNGPSTSNSTLPKPGSLGSVPSLVRPVICVSPTPSSPGSPKLVIDMNRASD